MDNSSDKHCCNELDKQLDIPLDNQEDCAIAVKDTDEEQDARYEIADKLGKRAEGACDSAVYHPEGNSRFTGVRLDEVMVLEFFSGTGRLTRAVKDLGMAAMAVDKDNKLAQSVHVATYDLNDPDQLAALSDFIRKHHRIILWAHLAPSCGTASRARGRPLPKLSKLGIKVPQPLRSDAQPMGLDGLGGLDKVKAESANITYDSTVELMQLCIQFHIAVSVENPANSLFWKIHAIEQILHEIGGYMTYFDNCCHGGTRQKATGWWANVDWFTSLAAKCDGSHFHEKWNAEIIDGQVMFPTHLEAAYPILLCQRLASIAKLKALEFGAIEVHTLEQQVEHAPSSQHRFLLDMLPRGRHYQQWAIAVPGSHEHQVLSELPKGAKVVHRQFKQWHFRVDGDGSADTDTKVHSSCLSNHEQHEVITIGMPREPLEFFGTCN